MIACSKLDDYLYVPTAWGVALDVRRDPDVFSRDPRFVTWSVHDLTNGKQNSQFRNFPFSDRVFLAHVCFIYLKTAVGPTMVTKGGSRSCTTSSIGTSPPGKQICFSMLCSGDFHLKGTSGVNKSLSRQYTGGNQYKTPFELGFLFLSFNI